MKIIKDWAVNEEIWSIYIFSFAINFTDVHGLEIKM